MPTMPTTPLMAPGSSKPYIPTGYESQVGDVARKRRIAEALLQQGLAGPGAGAKSWTQLFGSLAQAWAGNRLEKKASQTEADVNARRVADYQRVTGELSADAQRMSPEQLVQKYSSNPLVQEQLEPYIKAFTKQMEWKATPNMQNVNGVYTDMRKAVPGTYAPNDPNAGVIRDTQGNLVVNDAATVSAQARQGFAPTTRGPFQDPGVVPLVPASGGPTPTSVAEAPAPPPITGDPGQIQRFINALRPDLRQGAEATYKQDTNAQPDMTTPVGSPISPTNAPVQGGPNAVDNVKIINGQPYYYINGSWHDSPKG